MHKNKVWLSFLCLYASIAMWFMGAAVYSSYHYWKMSASRPPSQANWSVAELSSEVFVPQVAYTFEVAKTSFAGRTMLTNHRYIHPKGAEQALTEFSAKKWAVWYNPADPQESTLQKMFPFKECISALILFGLLLYFIWLGFFVTRFNQGK